MITTEYLCYLMNRAQMDAEGSKGYFRLCSIMYETEFFPIHEMDENRCYDCINLRHDFAAEYSEDDGDYQSIMDILDGTLGENGTMLEITIVLAERMKFEMMDSQYDAPCRKWFMEMLCNCGLDEATNERMNEEEDEEEQVKSILDNVIFHKTGWDGEGGYFPLMYPQYDQRVVELIVQMNNYIEENYDIS